MGLQTSLMCSLHTPCIPVPMGCVSLFITMLPVHISMLANLTVIHSRPVRLLSERRSLGRPSAACLHLKVNNDFVKTISLQIFLQLLLFRITTYPIRVMHLLIVFAWSMFLAISIYSLMTCTFSRTTILVSVQTMHSMRMATLG